jgi:hypothetical protein
VRSFTSLTAQPKRSGWTRLPRFLLFLIVTAGISLTSTSARELFASDARTLTAAIREARPGDAIVLRNGTWTDARITFEAQGTAEQPITLRAETPGQVILTGRSTLRIGGGVALGPAESSPDRSQPLWAASAAGRKRRGNHPDWHERLVDA